MRHYILPALLLAAFSTTPVRAEETTEQPWGVETSVDVFSDYMFRGLNLYPGSSIQPQVTGSYTTEFGTLSGNVWAHLSAEGGDAEGVDAFTEIDGTLSYTYDAEAFSFSVGHIWYTFPDDDDDIDDTAEVFGSLTLNTLLSPTLTVYHDYDEFDTQYYELGLSHTFEAIAGEASLTPEVEFGFGTDTEKVYADNGFIQSTVGLSLDVPVGDLSVTPNVHYTFEADDNAVNEFWFGTALGYSF